MQKKRVLVVDEDENILEQIEEILFTSGYDPIMTSDARAALNIANRLNPNVILLDLSMASLNGFELADNLNCYFEGRDIPIIATNEYLRDEFKVLMDLCGINKCLSKPLRPLEVIAAIEELT